MSKIKKILVVALVSVVVLVVIAIVAFMLFGEKMIKVAIDTAGTQALGVAVKVDSVHLGLLKGEVGISGLTIANPPGYQHDQLLNAKTIEAKANIKSFLSDTPEITLVRLDGIDLVMEQKGLTSNLKDLMKNIPETAEKPEKAPEEAPAEKPEAGKKVKIDRIEITNVTVMVKLLPLPGKSDTMTIKLDPIILENVGGGEEISVADVTSKVMVALTKGVAKQGAGVLPDDLVGGLNTSLKGITDIGGKTLEEGGKVLEGGGKVIEGGLEKSGEAIEGIKGLFTPKKKEVAPQQ